MAFTGSYPFATNGLGVQPGKADTFSTTGDALANPQLNYELGTRASGSMGAEFLYVAAGGTINAGDVVILQGEVEGVARFTAVQLTSTNGKSKLGAPVGVACATAASGNNLWIQRNGLAPNVNLNTTTPTPYSAMHTSATAGQLTTTAASGTSATITGIVAENNAQVSGGNACWLTFPAIGAND